MNRGGYIVTRLLSRIGNYLLIVACAVSALWTGQALSQNAIKALEEIVVTASKREENLQDVGLALSALSKTEIEQQFTRDIKGLANVAPNVILADTS